MITVRGLVAHRSLRSGRRGEQLELSQTVSGKNRADVRKQRGGGQGEARDIEKQRHT